MTEVTPTFVYIFQATYTPENVPLWQGVNAALPRHWMFKTEEELNAFLEKNNEIIHCIKRYKILAAKVEDKYYPLKEPFSLP
jgi:hypothetical protein